MYTDSISRNDKINISFISTVIHPSNPFTFSAISVYLMLFIVFTRPHIRVHPIVGCRRPGFAPFWNPLPLHLFFKSIICQASNISFVYPIVQFVLNLTTFICSSVHPLPAQVSVQFPNQCSAYQINSCISILPCLLNLDSMNVPISPPYPAASLHNQEWSPLVILINFSNIIHFTQTLYHVFLQQLSLISTYFHC